MIEENLRIGYSFLFQDGNTLNCDVLLNPETLSLVRPTPAPPFPEWTKLENHKCACCPLTTDECLHCPVAVNIAGLIDAFGDRISFDPCKVTCTTRERTYVKETTVQQGLFSIFGLVMATSGCPEMALFKAMARFHLPFSTIEETIVRVTAMHCLRRYFESQEGGVPVIDLHVLDAYYEKIQTVNEGLFKRIEELSRQDANKNAMIILDSISRIVSIEIRDGLQSLRYLFAPAPAKDSGREC